MHVHGLHALSDNYIWLIQYEQDAWVVDPGEAEPVQRFLADNELSLKGILITHHHADHTAGVASLVKHFPTVDVYGHALTPLAAINHRVKQQDVIQLGPYSFRVLETPGHTLDHLAYVSDKALFCGDTLFTGGCGRLFEGTAAQMADSLLRLRELDEQLAVYCGHEYTLTNLNFAHLVEPDNQAIIQRRQQTVEAYQQNRPCVPSTLALEKQTNPFLRFDLMALSPAIIQYGQLNAKENRIDRLFGTLRAWKDKLDQTGELDTTR